MERGREGGVGAQNEDRDELDPPDRDLHRTNLPVGFSDMAPGQRRPRSPPVPSALVDKVTASDLANSPDFGMVNTRPGAPAPTTVGSLTMQEESCALTGIRLQVATTP